MYVAVLPFQALPGKMEEFKSRLADIGNLLLDENPGYQGGYVLQQPGNDDEVLIIHLFDTEADATRGPTSDKERAMLAELPALVNLEKAVAERKVYRLIHRVARSDKA